MIFKREDYMMYPFIANILYLTLNVSLVMSQGLSRYDKKGKILLMTYFCRLSYKLFETKIEKSMNSHLIIFRIPVLQILM